MLIKLSKNQARKAVINGDIIVATLTTGEQVLITSPLDFQLRGFPGAVHFESFTFPTIVEYEVKFTLKGGADDVKELLKSPNFLTFDACATTDVKCTFRKGE